MSQRAKLATLRITQYVQKNATQPFLASLLSPFSSLYIDRVELKNERAFGVGSSGGREVFFGLFSVIIPSTSVFTSQPSLRGGSPLYFFFFLFCFCLPDRRSLPLSFLPSPPPLQSENLVTKANEAAFSSSLLLLLSITASGQGRKLEKEREGSGK